MDILNGFLKTLTIKIKVLCIYSQVYHFCVCVCVSHSIMPNSLPPHGLLPARPLCPLDSPGKNTGVGCHALLQGVFPTLGLNPGLLHGRWDSLPTESPVWSPTTFSTLYSFVQVHLPIWCHLPSAWKTSFKHSYSGSVSVGVNGNPLQYSCLESPVDKVRRVTKNWTQLSG